MLSSCICQCFTVDLFLHVLWLTLHFVISGFCREADDNCVLLGCYAVILVIYYRRLRKKYRSHLQESNIFCLYSWSLRIGTICRTETSLRNYHHSLRNNRDVRCSLQIFHYLFRIANPNYAVQFYLFNIQYSASSTVIKQFTTDSFQASLTLSLLVPNIFFNTPLIKHPQPLLFPQYKRPNFPPNQRQQYDYCVLHTFTIVLHHLQFYIYMNCVINLPHQSSCWDTEQSPESR